MRKILWISASVPYDKVAHAGGKIHNYYLKYLKQHSNDNIKLITFFWEKDKEKIDLDKYGIDYILLKRAIWSFPRLLINFESIVNPYNRYAGINQNYTELQIRNSLRKLKKTGYNPDIIILQWTEMVVFWKIIKRYFPNAKMIAIEEDVKFLNYERAISLASGSIKRYFKKIKYRKLKMIEISACSQMNKVILNNPKDYELIRKQGIVEQKLFIWQPYFENRVRLPFHGEKKQILFYGAMNREENWKSAIWFLENVFYQLEDKQIEFYIVGGNPVSQLREYENERVHITGFVDDVGEYFANSYCLVAPLLLGAGIKIKVLEAMSAGIPVITNQIGIEGIPVQSGKEYIYAETCDEYIKELNDIFANRERQKMISEHAKKFIEEEFSLENSADRFVKLLHEI